MKRIYIILAVLSITLGLTLGIAQEKSSKEVSQLPTGFRGDFIKQLDDVQKKITDLAQAMPQEKYTWRPMEGVRSVSEVFMHIAGANFSLPKFVGVTPPEGYKNDMEKTVTEKNKIIATLKQSFEHLRQAAMKTSDADLDKPAKWFGEDVTVRYVYFAMATHLHEHLGQSIAYARSNGVVPPWTAAEQEQQKQKDSKK